MKTKKLLISLLAVVNAVLGLALLAGTRALPPAFAQAGAAPGSFLVVTAKPEGHSYRVLWLLDLAGDKLHAFFPQNPGRRDLVPVEPRTLSKDFVKQQNP